MAPLPGEIRGEDPRCQEPRRTNRFSGDYKPGKHYDIELRQRIVQAYKIRAAEMGEERPHGLMAELAREFKVDPSTIKSYVIRYEERRSLSPLARGTTNYSKVELGHLLFSEKFLELDTTRYIWELRALMAQTLEGKVEQPWISETSIWRILKEQLGLSHKKLSLIASQQMTAENEARREAYLAEALQVPAEEILVADETAFSYNNGLRRYGWASAHGETRAVDIRPKIFCPNHSCIGVLSTEGFEHVSIKKGAVDGEDWWEFICQCEPIFASGKFKLFVADNASVHKLMEDLVRHFLQEYGIKLLYLPAYSPDLSPIEEAFSKVKVVAQDGREDVRRDMESHIVRGFASVTPDDARGYFRLYTR